MLIDKTESQWSNFLAGSLCFPMEASSSFSPLLTHQSVSSCGMTAAVSVEGTVLLCPFICFPFLIKGFHQDYGNNIPTMSPDIYFYFFAWDAPIWTEDVFGVLFTVSHCYPWMEVEVWHLLPIPGLLVHMRLYYRDYTELWGQEGGRKKRRSTGQKWIHLAAPYSSDTSS